MLAITAASPLPAKIGPNFCSISLDDTTRGGQLGNLLLAITVPVALPKLAPQEAQSGKLSPIYPNLLQQRQRCQPPPNCDKVIREAPMVSPNCPFNVKINHQSS